MNEHVDIAIIGSGFAGIGAAIRLQQAGFEDYVVLERAGDVGGTWRDNSYPGFAPPGGGGAVFVFCFVPSLPHSTILSCVPPTDVTRPFPPRPHITAYLRRPAGQPGVTQKTRLGAEV